MLNVSTSFYYVVIHKNWNGYQDIIHRVNNSLIYMFLGFVGNFTIKITLYLALFNSYKQ
jgi:hypothetical protein